MTMKDWIEALDRQIVANRRKLLQGSGSVSHKEAMAKAEKEFEIYRKREMALYTVVDGLITKMKLTAAEYETLCAYMAGLTYLEVTRLLNVNRTTIWRRRMSLQRKYALATNSL